MYFVGEIIIEIIFCKTLLLTCPSWALKDSNFPVIKSFIEFLHEVFLNLVGLKWEGKVQRHLARTIFENYKYYVLTIRKENQIRSRIGKYYICRKQIV